MPLDRRTPAGWFVTGSNPGDYRTGLDIGMSSSGTQSAFIQARSEESTGMATIMQAFSAQDYVGQRLRLRGTVKAWGVRGRAGLWIRVDGATKKNLVLDNMQDRPIKESVDWTGYDLVVDVPPDGSVISLGVALSGFGQVWVDNFALEKVGADVPVTSSYSDPQETTCSALNWPAEPKNLDFEEPPQDA
jgi:hypothetical protein